MTPPRRGANEDHESDARPDPNLHRSPCLVSSRGSIAPCANGIGDWARCISADFRFSATQLIQIAWRSRLTA